MICAHHPTTFRLGLTRASERGWPQSEVFGPRLWVGAQGVSQWPECRSGQESQTAPAATQLYPGSGCAVGRKAYMVWNRAVMASRGMETGSILGLLQGRLLQGRVGHGQRAGLWLGTMVLASRRMAELCR